MPIVIKPFLYLLAFGQTAVLFAGVFGLACLLLMTCVRAITWLPRAAKADIATLAKCARTISRLSWRPLNLIKMSRL